MKVNKLFFWFFLVTAFACETDQQKTTDKNYSTVVKVKNYYPEMVAPGIISKASFEGHASVSPLGDEIYFSIYSNDHSYSLIAYSTKTNNKWSEPKVAPFSGHYSDGSPALSPDGKKLFFSSRRPIDNSTKLNSSNDIWYVEREDLQGKWGPPKRLNQFINTEHNEFSPSIDQEGNLFFCSNRPGGFGDMDVYFSALNGKYYDSAVLLSENINSKYHEGNVGVHPNGDLLFVMVQHKPGDFGYDDIHFSRKVNGKWSNLKNLGKKVNTKTYDFSPKISPDGKTLYFSSRLSPDFNEQETKYSYQSFLDQLSSPFNGLGNIYKIELSELSTIK